MDPEAPMHLSALQTIMHYGAKLHVFPQVLLIYYYHEPRRIRLQPSRRVFSTSSSGTVDLVARVVCIPHLLWYSVFVLYLVPLAVSKDKS
jgi:hypothetical protein